MDYRTENIIKITWIVKGFALNNFTRCIPYNELKEVIDLIAEKFKDTYPSSDWEEFSYEEEIFNFTSKQIAVELWSRLEDVPINPETEEIEEEWNDFPVGTHREEIWHWFEETFDVSVAEDLM